MNERDTNQILMPTLTRDLDPFNKDNVITVIASLLLFFTESMGLSRMIAMLGKNDDEATSELFAYFAKQIQDHATMIGVGMFYHALQEDEILHKIIPTELAPDFWEDDKIRAITNDPQILGVLRTIWNFNLNGIIDRQLDTQEMLSIVMKVEE